jgi:hypothetical protein
MRLASPRGEECSRMNGQLGDRPPGRPETSPAGLAGELGFATFGEVLVIDAPRSCSNRRRRLCPEGAPFSQPRATPWGNGPFNIHLPGQRPKPSPGEPLARWAGTRVWCSLSPGRCPGLGEPRAFGPGRDYPSNNGVAVLAALLLALCASATPAQDAAPEPDAGALAAAQKSGSDLHCQLCSRLA